MELVLKVAVLVLSLGVDTLLMSISLGIAPRTTRSKLRIGLTFGLAEAVMPLVGLGLGSALGSLIGDWASLGGGIALVACAVWLLFLEGERSAEDTLKHDVMGWALAVTALSISVDELAVGFSIGLIGVPVALTVILIGLQAFCFTLLGLTLGRKLKRYLGEWCEKLTGIALGSLGVWIVIAAMHHIIRGTT